MSKFAPKILSSSYFFEQICSQNLKFTKLTEILYRDTCLYAYYNFKVSKFFSFISFGQIRSQNVMFSRLTKVWYYRDTLPYAYYEFNVYFSNFLPYFLGKIWSQNLKFFKLTEIWFRVRLLYSYYDFKIYFFRNFAFHTILGKFGPRI